MTTVALFVPEHDHQAFQADLETLPWAVPRKPPLLDVGWGLERMISKISGINPEDAGPLPKY